jgi:hypothetical protein
MVTYYDACSRVTMHGHMLRCTVTCYDARSRVTMHGHVLRCMVTCYDAWSHVMMHGHMLRCMATCYDAWSHVTIHGHALRCMATCYDAWSHVTIHGHALRCMATCYETRSHERKKNQKCCLFVSQSIAPEGIYCIGGLSLVLGGGGVKGTELCLVLSGLAEHLSALFKLLLALLSSSKYDVKFTLSIWHNCPATSHL